MSWADYFHAGPNYNGTCTECEKSTGTNYDELCWKCEIEAIEAKQLDEVSDEEAEIFTKKILKKL